MSPVDLYIPTYPDNYIEDARERLARRRQITPRGKAYVALCYALVVASNFLWIFYVLVPFYMSGYDQLSDAEIQYSHRSLTDFTEYPLYASGIADFVGLVVIVSNCFGFPIFIGLLVELVYKWPSYNWRTNAVKIACLFFVASVIAYGWEAADKLRYLLYG
jgi:hypothetical protein